MEVSNKAGSNMPAMIRNVKAAQRDAFLKGLHELLRLLRQHAQMRDNPHDGRTPRPLFFTWEFIQRTCGNLSQVPVDKLEANDRDALEKYSDCVGRAIMAEIVITEKTPMAAIMRGGELDFGYVARKAAKAAAVAGGGEEGKRHV
ncbi:hypothetical protein HO173_012490 [Letharia columbiana]|uniref:Uncharacterized protein n=1 Tax=Letharia columbiana TaxID=112416 RepID=A0A8H6CP07_9LECA|nr:uncharacterized protein HO173_012490 [Letharia columbiana]KAF6226591.1 hypothetical protein HO173_012490 [Letharia columbiana]